jgi:hypothetical protein
MARGAAAGAAGQPAAAAPGDAGDGGQPAAIPEKYIVKNEDGTTNWEASALKQAQGYTSLAQRLGAGEAPPKSPEDYAPELPQGMTMDSLKADPMFAGFLKGAHAKGLNNGQVSYLLGEFQQRMQMLEQQRNDPGVAEAELRKTWQTDQQMDQGLSNAARATAAFAGDQDTLARLEKKFGNDPDYLRLMANIGKELGEDKPVGGLTSVETETRQSLMASEAYLNAKHPEHATVVAKVKALYAKQHGG